jgi:predicted transcriptional regulator
MRGLWKQSSGTATEITVVINGRRDAPISSKTVLTCLTRLESKGLVFHVKQNRSFRFYPALSEGQMEAKFVGEEIGEMINRFGDLAVAVFVDRLGKDPERLKHLREILEVTIEGRNA